MTLPIEKYKQELVDAVREYETLIVVGDTGSGKTTQIPKYILQSFDFKVSYLLALCHCCTAMPRFSRINVLDHSSESHLSYLE